MNSSETVGQRFVQLIAHLGISKNAFAASLDKTATVVQHLVDERNKPGFDLLCKIFEIYPNVSKDWLLQGEGPMLTGGAVPATAAAKASVAATPVTAVKKETEPDVPLPGPAEEPTLVSPPVRTNVAAPGGEITSAPAVDAPVAAPFVGAALPAADTSWQTALYTQQMAHQLALAELRNQHLQEQQRMMQQMLDLMQRQLSK